MSTAIKPEARDLDADLAICEAATRGPWMWTWNGLCLSPEGAVDSGDYVAWLQHSEGPNDEDRKFIADARAGWPYAIRRSQEAEQENDKLRDEINLLQEQLKQHRSHCFD
ncbi:hypothetical protein [Cohnella luojiensis]|uniref:Uncharacterized protein n=1 Tax=Cohnella luojiensis TaxID=652876 RepID=A0A4Y8M7T6_9BACL|nr:hypothetical protein [Cohnella luojiensis]TFE30809.1 hypothetical protein E2980_03255 [Cohnella luojiensis]